MPRYLMLLFLDYCLLGKRSDCLRVLKDLHLTLIDFFSPLVFSLILSLTDKSRISLCVAVLVSPEPISHAQLHQRFLTNLCNLLWYAQLLTICFHQKVSLGYKQCVLLWTSEKVNYVFHWVITLPQSHLILFSVKGFFCYVFFFPLRSRCRYPQRNSHINLLTVSSVEVLKTEIYLTAAP